MQSYFDLYYERFQLALEKTDYQLLSKVAELFIATSKNRGKVILAGNGGSASIASHSAVDLTKTATIRAINFNEADLITCFANDYGYERWVEKALDFYADEKDTVVLISSSGRSMNMVNGAINAKRLGLNTVTFTGFDADNPLRKLGDINLWIANKEYNMVEMTHQIWLLSIVDAIIDRKKEEVFAVNL